MNHRTAWMVLLIAMTGAGGARADEPAEPEPPVEEQTGVQPGPRVDPARWRSVALAALGPDPAHSWLPQVCPRWATPSRPPSPGR